MALQLDHFILAVNDRQQSIDFYTRVLGLTYEGEREPFSVIRVTPELILLLGPWGTKGGQHLAFSVSRVEFNDAMERLRRHGVEYGDSVQSVGNMRAPGNADGAKGASKSVYVLDPNRHLIELTYYDAA